MLSNDKNTFILILNKLSLCLIDFVKTKLKPNSIIFKIF